ncbi:MAG: UDP-N-acetylmuramate--L-alanine ligase [Candidatus Solibacter usitatus]|nr:UDP-N-acetylmuramate--L-alanine ligase [Candidatus Solibacter usitatus]
MFFRPQRLHFTGIGGIGMSGIAEVLLNLGYEVTGSDAKLSPITTRLRELGAVIWEGHDASHVAGAKALVVSSAIAATNPEYQEARRLQIPVIPRGELLAELMRIKYGIAVGGSHGKTTTTSMASAVLADLDPTVVVGGRVRGMGGSNARIGKSEFLVVESDESDGSFLKLAPILAVVTNIDCEHLDHYQSLEKILDAFVEFVNRVPFYGACILCLDDENIQRILPRVQRRTVTYGLNPQASLFLPWMATGPQASEFALRLNGRDLGVFRVGVPGAHNVLNATAAVAVALELDIPLERIRQTLAGFNGVDRRFQIRGEEGGVTVIDDYGHHPTEVRATLATARVCQYERVHVLFQPHRYTRTAALLDDFARAFHQADSVTVLDIYAASEPPMEGVHSQVLVNRLREFGHKSAQYAASMDEGIRMVSQRAKPGDAILTLGAGSVSQTGDRILDTLRAPVEEKSEKQGASK